MHCLMCGRVPCAGRRYHAGALVTLLLVLGAARAHAVCNLIPLAPSQAPFQSTLGVVTTPFGSPGQIVTIGRPGETVFSRAPAANRITLRFHPLDGPEATITNVPALAPTADSDCTPDACAGDRCRCVSFSFPDTAGEVGDGHPLTGPVSIEVRTGGETTAQIDTLFAAGEPLPSDDFPTFVALPQANRFDHLLGGGGELLAGADIQGNLLVPFDFSAFVPPAGAVGTHLIRFLEARVPALMAAGQVQVESFTIDGRRLPPLLRQVNGTDLLGSVDAPRSVLRVKGGAHGLAQEGGKGPVVIPDVTGFADLHKRATPFSSFNELPIAPGKRFAVYETRECGPADPPAECVDLNGDGDQRDYFLLALDSGGRPAGAGAQQHHAALPPALTERA